ncbi:Homocysteine S-methyltransferase 1 [Seminavis robusta]|uniref:Homocysteine S-methyltransferase 1 n=1 Tax=Seminavis robusta TaxID=568900 RepID=A0A9N8H7F4_9STRA|nr:Homocysteine S-methyltransferase 1 [Seminavis robusta]|eukprot:Sro127_g060970.1 Homocysteine S-methyltransferase 1 (611) ;mRNA; f:95061-96893
MTLSNGRILVAVNGIFAVSRQRGGEFLASFSSQLQNSILRKELDVAIQGNDPPSLLSCIVGENSDSEDETEDCTTFHCHLKFECATREEAVAAFVDNKPKLFRWDESAVNHPPFYLLRPPQINVWTVAPEAPDAPPNPKPTPTPPGCRLFCLNANLHVRPEHRQEFLQLLEHARSESIQEPLCVEYQFGESLTTPNSFHVHQAYMGDNGGKEGFDKHATTQHYQKWNDFSKDENKDPFVTKPVGYTFRPGFPAPSPLLLLDGGNGHELKQRGVISDGSFLAGLLANEQQPEIVQSVHREFVRDAGCHIITTNSFVAVPDRVERDLFTCSGNDNCYTQEDVQERTRQLIQAAVHCARTVAKEFPERNIQVAGTIPPLTECYVASLVPTTSLSSLVLTYRFLIETLVQADVDILLAETLSTSREAIAIVKAMSQLKQPPPPLWIALTIDDFNNNPTTLRSGEPLDQALNDIFQEALAAIISIRALGVNCASPAAVTRAIPVLVQAANNQPQRPQILAYANAFQTTTSEWLARSDEYPYIHDSSDIPALMIVASGEVNCDHDYDAQGVLKPEVYGQYAKEWRALGATIIGGCCGSSPSHLQAVATELGLDSRR